MEHLEGRQSVHAALAARQRRFEVILIAHGAHEQKLADLLQLAEEMAVPIKRVDRAQLDAMSHANTHGGVLAIASAKPRLDADQLLHLVDTAPAPPLLLLLEGVDDARNLGFTLRTAEAMGVIAVLIKKHLWDLDAVEIARPSSGAYERLPLVQIDSIHPLQQLQKRGLRIYGLLAAAKRTIYQRNLKKPLLLAIGGEKRGLSGAVRGVCDRFVSIPTAGGASSLSLSHAAAIVLSEVRRQRTISDRSPPSTP